MRTTRLLMAADGYRVAEVSCTGEPSGWSPEEAVTQAAIVLVRSGVFRRRVNGREAVMDPMVGYLEQPDSFQQVAHLHGGDHCTVLVPPSHSFPETLDGSKPWGTAVTVSSDLDVHHRILVARARAGADTFELVERVTQLVGRLLDRVLTRETRRGTPPPARVEILVGQVREALTEDIRVGLRELATSVGVSPYYLSRSFHASTGITLTRYRRQLQIKRGFQRLAEGERNLARLAADLGFSDQAHFTRATREEAGTTPGHLRAILSEET